MKLWELVTLPIGWAAIVLGALQLHRLVPETGHAICGPWGCGPDTGALVAVHAGWLAVIGPPVLFAVLRFKLASRIVLRTGLVMLGVGVGGLLGVVAWQRFVWLPQASEWARDYFWQRCGFAVLTAVDWPLIPMVLLAGTLLLLVWMRPAEESLPRS